MLVKELSRTEKPFYAERDYRDMTAKCNAHSRLDHLAIKSIFRTTGELEWGLRR